MGGADEVPVLRTSGLLSRSNKVMYDLRTESVFDTFTGAAVSGPLRDAGLVLEETTGVRTTWGEWKAAHPDTTIIAEDGGVGRSYPSIHSRAATTTARSSRSARPTTDSTCRNWSSGRSHPTAPPLPSPPTPPGRHSPPANRSRRPGWNSSPTAAGSVRRLDHR
jgi:hypothetical protein